VKRVLLADDSSGVRKALRRIFEQAGWSVCAEASNGQEAISNARKMRPDIIVLDLSMPTMNGLDAGRILKAIFPRIPLILFTSFGGIVNADDLHHAGFSALIDKMDAGKLVPTAETLLEAA